MLSQFTNKFFWFTQPSSFLNQIDKNFGYFFLGLLLVGIIIRIFVWLSKNQLNRRLLLKFWHLLLTIGILGLLWFGFRYENTPILSIRAWMGSILIIGLIWLVFVLKFLAFDYRKLKSEYEREVLKNKYVPKSR